MWSAKWYEQIAKRSAVHQRQTDGRTDGQTDRQTNRQTDRLTYSVTSQPVFGNVRLVVRNSDSVTDTEHVEQIKEPVVLSPNHTH